MVPRARISRFGRFAIAAGVAVGLSCGLAAPAQAQPRRPSAADAPPANSVDRREQVKKRIRSLRAYTLTEELRLDEQTAGRLFPVLARYDDEIDKLLERRVDIQRRLRRADAMRDPRAIDRLIDEALTNQRAFWELEDRKVADLRKVLSPQQTAKLLIVLPAIDRRIQNQLRKAITQRRPGAAGAAAGRPGAAAADPDDDDPEPDELAPPRQRREGPLAPRNTPANAPGNTPPCDPSRGPCR